LTSARLVDGEERRINVQMNSPALRALIRRILLPNLHHLSVDQHRRFLSAAVQRGDPAGPAGGEDYARSAHAIGEYTETHILPKLTAMSPNSFEPEQVPFYASRTVFHTVTGKAALYTFRFPTFNPTNPLDRPIPFELGLMNRFRDEANLTELTGVQNLGEGKVFYLAQPIRIEDRSA
jgi:uncharacterized protein DUF3365